MNTHVNRTNRTLVLVLAIAASALIAYWVLRDDDSLCKADPLVCPCMKLLQDDKSLSFTFETDPKTGGLTKFIFGGSKTRTGDPSPELADKFVDCLANARKPIEILNYARIPSAPLGQIAHHWARQNGLEITLRPRDDDEKHVVNNLQIGPLSGVKWQVLKRWCSDQKIAPCVECGNMSPDKDTVAVEIRLRESAEFHAERLSDGWPTTGDRRPWEYIDSKGVRYVYACGP